MATILLNVIILSGLNFSIFSSVLERDILLFYADQGGKVLGAEASFFNIRTQTLPKNNDVPPQPQAPVKKNEAAELDLDCASAAVLDLRTGKILFDKNADKEAPIASITKLMTALVFLDHNPGWETIYEMKAEDKREGGKINLFTGEKVMVRDLFYSSLVASDNVATIGLINSTGMSLDDFIAKMNEKAIEIGLNNTKFMDPLGLNDNNISNAMEIARLANKALLKDEIREATMTKVYEFKTQQGRAKAVYSTDDLLSVFPEDGIEIKGGKTGYTEAAGYCFVGKFGNDGDEIVSVVLNGDSKNSRFDQTHILVKWVYDNYAWD